MASFDPYYKWLAIPPTEQPPNHYRLLGLVLFESNTDVIDMAAEQRTVFLRTFQLGSHVELAERLLNEVSLAKYCLLNAREKTEYDNQLKNNLSSSAISTAAPTPKVPPSAGTGPSVHSPAPISKTPPLSEQPVRASGLPTAFDWKVDDTGPSVHRIQRKQGAFTAKKEDSNFLVIAIVITAATLVAIITAISYLTETRDNNTATNTNSSGQTQNPEEANNNSQESVERSNDPLPTKAQPPFENEKEPDDPSSTGQFTSDAVKSLFQQCQDLQWKPETLSDYAKLQGLAKLITDHGRAGESEDFDADQKEAMLKDSLRVMETLSTTSWGDQLQITSTNKLATEALQNRQELGVFAYAEVSAQVNRQSDGANVVFFKLLGTDQHVAVTAKENSGQLTPGSRWLILGEFNFLRTIRLTDGNTGNTIKAREVIAYYVIEEPK